MKTTSMKTIQLWLMALVLTIISSTVLTSFYCLDNSHNNGGRRVTTEEAKQWDYTMTEDLQQKIYAIKQSYIDSGKLTPEQIAALH